MKKIIPKLLCLSAASLLLLSISSPMPAIVFASEEPTAEQLYEENTDFYSENDSQIDSELSNNSQNPTQNQNANDGTAANENIPIAKIVVYGAGKVIVSPDIAYISVGVESVNSNLQSAIKENNDTIISIIQYLNGKNIAENDIKTKYYSVYQSRDYSTSEKFQEYHVVNTLEYKTADLDNLGETISQLTNLGANRVEDIQFDCSTISDCYQNALKLALEDAKSKAKSFTNKDLTIDRISEECVFTCMPYRSTELLTQSTDSIKSGNIEIEAKITVVFK